MEKNIKCCLFTAWLCLAGIFFLVGLHLGNKQWHWQEIDGRKYTLLFERRFSFKELEEPLIKALEDNKITNDEFKKLDQLYIQLLKEN